MSQSKFTIFFSWQSDINAVDNKNYIEYCLKKSVLRLKNNIDFSVQLSIDKATNKSSGTIDISDSIFKKINISKIFVADVSIINYKARRYRKTPNPNVLIELGYAARTIGWENIICVFNTKYGKPDMLPFDLRNRRLLLYNSDDKKDELITSLTYAINNTHNLNIPSGIISDYYNAIIYTSLLKIIGDFGKILCGYENYSANITTIKEVLGCSKKKITDMLCNNCFLGFQLFKSYDTAIHELEGQLEKILVLKQFDDSYYVPLIRMIDCLRIYNKELNRRGGLDKYELLSKSEKYSLLSNDCSNTPNRLVLLRKINNSTSYVCDSGDIKKEDHRKELLTIIKLKDISVKFYAGFMFEMLEYINQWVDNNGGEFILDETRLEFHSSCKDNT